VFRPDVALIAFAHEKQDAKTNRSTWSIYMVEPDKLYTQNNLPKEIGSGFTTIGRLSWFPDNRRLLLWTPAGKSPLQILDTQTGQTTDIPLDKLLGLYQPHNILSKIADPTLNPSGTKFVFAGYVNTSTTSQGGWFLFTCNVDGSNLKQLTAPLSIKPELYRFSNSGKTTASKIGWATGE
jgi:hypothetical protein